MAALLTPAALPKFLHDETKLPWVWGDTDCVMWVARWVKARTGRDPAEVHRGAYRDGDGCRDYIGALGGFLPFIGMTLDEFGLIRTGSPQPGDIGVVSAPIGMINRMPAVGPVMAIRHGAIWVTRAVRGLHYEDFPTVTAWTF